MIRRQLLADGFPNAKEGRQRRALMFHFQPADDHSKDQLGGLRLVTNLLLRRDLLALDGAVPHKFSVETAVPAEYTEDVHSTVTIDCDPTRASRGTMALRSAAPTAR